MNEKEFAIFGLWDGEVWLCGSSGRPFWYYESAVAEHFAAKYGAQVLEMPDAIVATIPEAAEALRNYLGIKWLRVELKWREMVLKYQHYYDGHATARLRRAPVGDTHSWQRGDDNDRHQPV